MPDQLLFRLERQGYPVPDYEVTRLIDDGRVVLDIDNLPVKNYHNIPLTLSSEMEAYLMEMIHRMDTRITQRDFRARMPHTIQTGTGTKPIVSLSAVGMRLKRFRLVNACPSWAEGNSPGALKPFVKNLLSEEGLKRNSTQELSGLTKLQQEMVKNGRKRRYKSSASTQDPCSASRAQREQADARRWVRLQAAEKDKNEDLQARKKRKREAEPLLEFDSGYSSPDAQPRKTARLESDGQSGSISEQPSFFESLLEFDSELSSSNAQPTKIAGMESKGQGGSIPEPPSSSDTDSLDDLILTVAASDPKSRSKFRNLVIFY